MGEHGKRLVRSHLCDHDSELFLCTTMQKDYPPCCVQIAYTICIYVYIYIYRMMHNYALVSSAKNRSKRIDTNRSYMRARFSNIVKIDIEICI